MGNAAISVWGDGHDAAATAPGLRNRDSRVPVTIGDDATTRWGGSGGGRLSSWYHMGLSWWLPIAVFTKWYFFPTAGC